MKKSLLALALALGFTPTILGQHSPVPSVDPISLPDEIASVTPAQGFVDVSPNANPLGVGEISVRFKTSPTVNESCTAEAQCWYNGETKPIATATVAQANVDAMGDPVGALRFGKALVSPGTYHVSIPAGFWLIGSTPRPRSSSTTKSSTSITSRPEQVSSTNWPASR